MKTRSRAIRFRAGCSITRTTRGRRSFRDWKVPDVLVSGHHGEIRKWRKRQALELTLLRRPDLLADAELDVEEQEILRELMEAKKGVAHGRD